MTTFPPSALWSFSIKVYGEPDVAALCLELQDRHGVDVNILLATCWFAASGRGSIDRRQVDAMRAAIATLAEDVVLPLRRARRALKPLVVDPVLAALRTRVKQDELDAEHVVQIMLERCLLAMTHAHSGDGSALERSVAAVLDFYAAAPPAGLAALIAASRRHAATKK
jgi:uncharacterized protein (TIGR02444 family)